MPLKRFFSRIYRKRFIRYAIYFLCLLLITELGLRAAGYLIQWPIDRRIESGYPRIEEEGCFTVLCIGDSHTYGIGAPRGYSYPDQLHRSLVKQFPGRCFNVINGGVPGYNSSQALLRLRMFIDESNIRPDVIIVNVGKNNNHNLTGGTFWEDRLKTASWQEQFQYLLENSKLYRLGTITRINIAWSLKRSDENRGAVITDDRFLRSWLMNDYQEMLEIAGSINAGVAYLGYIQWLGLDFVHESMEETTEGKGGIFIDVRGRLPLPAHSGGILNPDWHPTKLGYAIIAGKILDELQSASIINAP